MKKGYWISLYIKIDDQENLKKYAKTVTPVIESYGGVPLIRGGKYQAGWAIAKNTTLRHMQIVEGFSTE